MLLFVWGLYDGLRPSFLGTIFPVGMCVAMLPVALHFLYVTGTNRTTGPANDDHEIEGEHVGREGVPGLITALSWIKVLDFPGGILQELIALPWQLR